MKIRQGIFLVIVTITTFFIASSCAKGTYAHKHKKSVRYNTAQTSPASKKSTPVTKKYVIKNKRKSTLGLSGTYRKGKKSDLIL